MKIHFAILLCCALSNASLALSAQEEGKATVITKPEIVVKQIDPAEKAIIGKGLRIGSP